MLFWWLCDLAIAGSLAGSAGWVPSMALKCDGTVHGHQSLVRRAVIDQLRVEPVRRAARESRSDDSSCAGEDIYKLLFINGKLFTYSEPLYCA